MDVFYKKWKKIQSTDTRTDSQTYSENIIPITETFIQIFDDVIHRTIFFACIQR